MGNAKKKQEQLGMPHGTATSQLRKSILFECVQRLDLDNCYRCGEKIQTLREFSIEHKQNWLDSHDPVTLFFDLDNIAFSHLTCNISSGRRQTRRVKRSDGVIFNSLKEAGKESNCRDSEICRTCQGVGKTAGGYGWSYVDTIMIGTGEVSHGGTGWACHCEWSKAVHGEYCPEHGVKGREQELGRTSRQGASGRGATA